MTDKVAYRASDELERAVLAWRVQVDEHAKLCEAWDAENPPGVFDRGMSAAWRMVGFGDLDRKSPPPDGLSRSQERSYLIPKRGKAGDRYRDAMERLDTYPPLDDVLKEFGVDTVVLRVDQGRIYRIGIHATPHGVFVACGVPLVKGDHPHLTEVPLSAFYAALEAAGEAA